MKFLEPTSKPKVIYTDNSLNLASLARNYPESMYVDTTQIRNKWDCRKSSAQSERRDICGAIAVRSGYRMVGGFCGTLLLSSKYLTDGKSPYERRFGCRSTDQQYRLEQWSNITLFLRKTNLDCISWAKVLPGYISRLCITRGRYLERDIMVADTEELEEMDASELHARRLNATDVLRRKEVKLHISSHRWNSRNLWVWTASENIHINPGASGTRTRNSSRKSRWRTFFNASSRRLNTGWCGS